MKFYFSFVVLSLILGCLLSSCSNKMSEADLKEMIIEGNEYRIQRDITINLNNVYEAAELERVGLVGEGYVKTNTKITINDPTDMRRIELTNKAKPFLIGQVEKETKTTRSIFGGSYSVFHQKVATYKMDFKEIVSVRYNKDENKAIVKYQVVFKNLTPFANVFRKKRDTIEEGQTIDKEAYFIRYEDGWKLEKKPSLDFLTF